MNTMADNTHDMQQIEAVRRFNRFYTRTIGVLEEGLLSSPFTLTEARVIYELAQRDGTTATDLRQELGLDAGYLSRVLRALSNKGLLDKRSSQTDARQYMLSLTKQGRGAFAALNVASCTEMGALLNKLPASERRRLIAAMHTIEELLGAETGHGEPYLLRPHQPGDMGWIVHRHGVLYSEEHGWDETFEALVAKIVARFARKYDPKRERCWIAERDGEPVGSVFLVRKSKTTAQLRLLLVEPKARGLGIGKRLVKECTRFARQADYRRIVLWTNSTLATARQIYEQEGYRLIDEAAHRSFGHDLVGQNWQLDL